MIAVAAHRDLAKAMVESGAKLESPGTKTMPPDAKAFIDITIPGIAVDKNGVDGAKCARSFQVPMEEVQVCGFYATRHLSRLQGHCVDCGLSTFAWCDGKPVAGKNGKFERFEKCVVPPGVGCAHAPFCKYCGAGGAWCHFCKGMAWTMPEPKWLIPEVGGDI